MDRNLLAVALENSKRRGIYFDFLALIKITAAILVAALFKAMGDEGGAYFLTTNIVGGVALILLSIGFTKVYGGKVKDELSLKLPQKKYYLYALLLFVSMFFGLSGVNGYFVEFLSKHFGYKYTEITIPEFSAFNFIAVTLVICVLPAIAEETAFRGVMLGGLRSGGKIGSALITGFAFTLYHASPAQTVYQFAVGFLFGLLAFESGSVLPTAAVHFLNNFTVVLLHYIRGGSMDFGGALNIILTVVGLAAVAAFLFLTLKPNEKGGEAFAAKWLILRKFLKYGFLGLAAYAALWILSLVAV